MPTTNPFFNTSANFIPQAFEYNKDTMKLHYKSTTTVEEGRAMTLDANNQAVLADENDTMVFINILDTREGSTIKSMSNPFDTTSLNQTFETGGLQGYIGNGRMCKGRATTDIFSNPEDLAVGCFVGVTTGGLLEVITPAHASGRWYFGVVANPSEGGYAWFTWDGTARWHV